jgi:hypothetical protein
MRAASRRAAIFFATEARIARIENQKMRVSKLLTFLSRRARVHSRHIDRVRRKSSALLFRG